jgi:hypothetical protein
MLGHLVDFGEDCRACHDGVDRYGEGFDHNRLAFPLEGEHANVQCAACHPAVRTIADLQAAPQECAACHQDDDPHQGDLGSECQACHTPLDWEQVNFDHALAAATSTCFACHESDDPHHGEFGQECGACHSTTSWLPAEFDHSKSQFPLTGAHQDVGCSGCHQDGVYKGTPTQCSACHAEPEYHLGAFGVECDACHTTVAWSPARYDRPHTFPIDHGEQSNTCRTCHPSALTAYTCTACHEQNEIAGKHLEEGIRDFADCTRCHATGQEHDEGGEGGGDD